MLCVFSFQSPLAWGRKWIDAEARRSRLEGGEEGRGGTWDRKGYTDGEVARSPKIPRRETCRYTGRSIDGDFGSFLPYIEYTCNPAPSQRITDDDGEALAGMHLGNTKLTPNKPVVKKLVKATGAENYNVLQNNGRIAHQEVDHVHFHMVSWGYSFRGGGAGVFCYGGKG